MALIFFGPRKLPQLSRTLGKNLAEFRKVSEDFKRTWEREVAMEDLYAEPSARSIRPEENSIMSPAMSAEPPAEEVVARQGTHNATATEPAGFPIETNGTPNEPTQDEPLRKHDWL